MVTENLFNHVEVIIKKLTGYLARVVSFISARRGLLCHPPVAPHAPLSHCVSDA